MALWIYWGIHLTSSVREPGMGITSKFAKLEGIYIPSLPPKTNIDKQTQPKVAISATLKPWRESGLGGNYTWEGRMER